MNGLKPCPFCGCEVEITTYRDEGYQIECPNHEWPEREMWGEKRPESDIAADIGMFTWGISDEAKTALIEAWNTRTPEQAIAATLGEVDEGCYLMRDGKKFPVELDFGFVGIMPIAVTVGGFRYLLEVPDEE